MKDLPVNDLILDKNIGEIIDTLTDLMKKYPKEELFLYNDGIDECYLVIRDDL